MQKPTPLAAALLVLIASLSLATVASADPPRPVQPSEAQRESAQALRDAELAGQRLLMLLDQARLNGDHVRVRCVDRRLSQVNSFSRTLEDRHGRLVRAEQLGEHEHARHERLVIRNVLGQLRQAEREGRACIFPIASGNRRTVVEVVIERHVPELDLPFRE